ncbi:uncharacterized protein UHOD_11544 [Ustilago sp. UG-2017b]|nr:uncharacterized protein UHOD_11544 [Ustilago sp. UG-2017b]
MHMRLCELVPRSEIAVRSTLSLISPLTQGVFRMISSIVLETLAKKSVTIKCATNPGSGTIRNATPLDPLPRGSAKLLHPNQQSLASLSHLTLTLSINPMP